MTEIDAVIMSIIACSPYILGFLWELLLKWGEKNDL